MKSNKLKPMDINSTDFDYCEWLTTEPTKKEFLAIWQQFTATEKAAVLQDFAAWLEAERDSNE